MARPRGGCDRTQVREYCTFPPRLPWGRTGRGSPPRPPAGSPGPTMRPDDAHFRLKRSPARTGAVGALLLACLILLPGCSAFNDHRAALRDLYAHGRFDQAAAVLDSEEAQKLYGRNEQLLYFLDRGAIALATGDNQAAIANLERAEALMESRFELSASEQAAQWLINDTARPYLGEPYESMYVNVLKLLAHLREGRVSGGATVEARRLASKADMLRARYLQYEEALYEEGGAGLQRAAETSSSASGGLISTNRAGEFIESPLGTFLTAVTFMHAGEASHQEVAARRLLDSLRLQRGLVGPVNPADFQGLGERAPQPGDVLIVALSGRGPTKRAERIGPIPVFDWPVYFELPVLYGGGSEVAASRLILQPITPGQPAPDAVSRAAEAVHAGPGYAPQVIPLALIEDMAAVATENHRRQLPLIYTRALLRSSLKAGASFAATQAVRRNTRDGRRSSGDDLAVLGSVIAGLAFVALTERADLRSWVFLPGQAHVGLINLRPGAYRVRVEYLSAGGGVLYATDWSTITIPPPGSAGGADLTTIVEYFWR